MAKQRVRVELFYDGVWNDHTNPAAGAGRGVYERHEIEVIDGRGDEQGEPTPSVCTLSFDNRAGLYNPRHALGALFGKIGRNTPLRVSVLGDSYLRTTADGQYASTPDHASLDIIGDIDIRVDCALDDYTDAGLCAKFGAAGQQSWAFYIGPAKQLLFWWSADGTTQTGFLASPALPVADGDRIAVRVSLDVDNGGGQREVRFWTAPTIAGPWTQHGSTQVGAVTSIFASTAPVEVGGMSQFGPVWSRGRFFAAEVYAGVSLRANPVFADRLDAAAFADSLGRTWTPQGGATIVPDSIRFVGEVASWKPRRAIKGDAWTLVEAAGILRRQTQGEEPSLSPWRRTITSAATAGQLLAYFPCEDDADSTAVASALGTGDPMTVTGTVAFAASGDTFRLSPMVTLAAGFGRSLDVGTEPLPNLASGGKFVGAVPAGVSSPLAWTVAWVSRTNALQAGENIVIARWFTPGGTYVRWDIVQKSSGLGYDVFGFTTVGGAGAALLATTVNDQVALTEYRVSALQNGTNVLVELHVAGNLEDSSNFITTTNARVTAVEMNPDSNSVSGVSGFWVGHVQVWDTNTAPSLGYSEVGQVTQRLDADGQKIYPWLGWLNERATDRLTRHMAEQGVPFRVIGARTDGVRMGPQPANTFTGLLAEAERTDVGVLADDRYAIGMTYRTRSNVYEQLTPVLALDFAAGDVVPPLDPDIDDLGVRNDVTAKRANGSSARSTLEVGPLSILPPPAGVGRVSRPLDVNPALDSVLPSLATWWRMKGTLPGTRYSQVTVELTNPVSAPLAAPHVIPGDLLAIANIPDDQNAALHVLGRVETIGSHTRRITFNAALAMSPLLVDTATRTVANGLGVADTGQPYTVSGGAASDYSVNGSKILVSAGTVAVLRHATAPVGQPDVRVRATINLDTGAITGAPATVWLAGRVTDTANYYAGQLQFGTDDSVKLVIIRRVAGSLAGISSMVTIAAGFGAGQQFTVELEVTGRTLRATAWPTIGSSPGWLLEVTDRSLKTGDGAGLYQRLEVGNTNALPVRYEWDDVRVVHPQVLNGA